MSQSVRLCVYEIERVDAREGGREREKERKIVCVQENGEMEMREQERY